MIQRENWMRQFSVAEMLAMSFWKLFGTQQLALWTVEAMRAQKRKLQRE
jgi:hypothetical protein